MMGASLNTADAKAKKDKGRDAEAPVPVTATDSLSYAAGMQQTQGLAIFLKQQQHVDSANYADFVRGFREAMSGEFDDARNAYIAGMMVASTLNRNLLPRMENMFEGDSINKEMFTEGFASAILGNAVMTDSMSNVLFEDAIERATKRENEATMRAGKEFLEANKTKEGVVTTASGLQYKVLTEGAGTIPTATDDVTVKYEGRFIDGTVFDSSYKRKGETAKFGVGQVIQGWTEALTMMPVGSKWEVYIPQELGYGSRKAGNIPPYSTLIFIVELVAIN